MADRRQTNNSSNHQQAQQPGTFQGRVFRKIYRRRNEYSAVSPLVKYVLFIINFLFLIAGVAFSAAGIYILSEKGKTVSTFIDFIFDPACDLCLAGLIILVIAFIGCGGALREFTPFLRIYYILLIIFFLLELVLVIFVFVFYFVDGAFANIGLYPEDGFMDAIKKYRDDPDMQDFIDNIQKMLSCCGASNDDNGYKDWNNNRYFNCSGKSPDACTVPYSCCKISSGSNLNYRCGANMLSDTSDLSAINTEGCLKGLQNLINDNIWAIGGSVIGCLVLQIFFHILC